jgi:N-methylhydantoinase A
MQFRGQTHLIRVAIPSPEITRDALQALFDAAYFQRFQVTMSEIKANVVNLNTSVIGRRRPFPLEALLEPTLRAPTLDGAETGVRHVFAEGRWHEARIFARERLPLDAVVIGPAVIEQLDATTVIEPGARATLDPIGNLRIKVRP